MSVPSSAVLGLVLCLLAGSAASAQRVLGRVVEDGDGAPVATAFVVLLDTADRRRAAGLTGDEGLFSLDAPGPGTYRIRVDRIGYRSTTTAPFTVGEGGAGPLTIAVPGDAVRVEPIEVEGARRCVLRPEDGEATYSLWSEARKALEITEWAGREERFEYHVLRFRRVLHPREMVVDSEVVESIRISAREPFYANSADELLERGFIQVEGHERSFYGPDAALLLSDAFLDAHCFRLAGADSAGLAGLSFEPLDREASAGVEGVLWLERATAELRFLEFRYVNAPLPARVDPATYGGIVRFHRMQDGSWIVSQWRIRSPFFVRRARRMAHGGFTETEGDVVAVRTAAGDPLPFERIAALLTGRVIRRGTGEPVAGIRVQVAGTPYESTTDAQGRFGFDGLPEGRYRIVAEGPGIRPIETVVHIGRGQNRSIVLSG